jgi:hypothetical protein
VPFSDPGSPLQIVQIESLSPVGWDHKAAARSKQPSRGYFPVQKEKRKSRKEIIFSYAKQQSESENIATAAEKCRQLIKAEGFARIPSKEEACALLLKTDYWNKKVGLLISELNKIDFADDMFEYFQIHQSLRATNHQEVGVVEDKPYADLKKILFILSVVSGSFTLSKKTTNSILGIDFGLKIEERWQSNTGNNEKIFYPFWHISKESFYQCIDGSISRFYSKLVDSGSVEKDLIDKIEKKVIECGDYPRAYTEFAIEETRNRIKEEIEQKNSTEKVHEDATLQRARHSAKGCGTQLFISGIFFLISVAYFGPIVVSVLVFLLGLLLVIVGLKWEEKFLPYGAACLIAAFVTTPSCQGDLERSLTPDTRQKFLEENARKVNRDYEDWKDANNIN